jgi:iron complex outermembrane receptor protein
MVPAVLSTLPIAIASAQEASDSKDEATTEVVVMGRGESRQVQSIGSDQIGQLPAGTSPLKAIEKLPGVNFQSADPFGAYEWSTRITVRGFNQNQLGFTLDGVPLGDMTYGNHNGLHISRAIPSELIDHVTMSQGTGSLGTASTSNLGGTVEFFSASPEREFGARLEQMLGSDDSRRTFARLDSGEFGPIGTRAYIAVVDGSTDKWRGNGDQQQRMYNLHIAQPVGAGMLTGSYDYSDRAEMDYQDLSLDMIQRRGYNNDNFYPNYAAAVSAAVACNRGVNPSTPFVCDDQYWNASGLRKDGLGSVSLTLPFGEAIEWKTTAYLHTNEGQGLWGTPYVPTPGGAPLSIRTTEYDIHRDGALTSLTYQLGRNEIVGGLWYETIDFDQARRYYGEPSSTAPTRSFDDFQSNPFLTEWQYNFDTDTTMFYLQDTVAVTDAVKVNAGFKSIRSKNSARTIVGAQKNGSIEAKEGFLPQVGVDWTLNSDSEVFGDIAKNVRTFVGSATAGPFSTSAAGFAAIRDSLEPETSTTVEAGWRFRGPSFDGVLTAYHVDFKDRLLAITQGPGIVGNPSVLANVGNVKTNGVEAALTFKPIRSVSWFNSVAWNSSEYDDDYSTVDANGAATVIPVSGMKVSDAPEFLLKSELAYDTERFFARLDANFTDKRYYTYLNDASVDSYTLLNLGVGYRFLQTGFADEITAQVDVANLTDEKYISTIGSNGFVPSDLSGTQQTLLTGAPRQIFFAVKARF